MASADTYTSQTGHTYVTVNGAWCLSVASPADTLAIDTTAVCVRIHPDSLLTDAMLDAAGFTTTDILVDSLYGGWYAVTVPPGSDCFAHLDSLESWSLIEWARFDIPFSLFAPVDDPLYSLQWGLQDPITEWRSAWDIVQGSSLVKVGIVDDYFEPHPDLVFEQIAGTPGGATDRAHGTMVAGVLAATTGNGLGVAGVAGGVKLYVNMGACTDARFSGALVSMASLGVRVVNFSAGKTGLPSEFTMTSTQIDSLTETSNGGMVIVGAAGQGEGQAKGYLVFPASHDRTIAVGAIESDLTRQEGHANTSRQGADIDVVAPGGLGGIVTTDRQASGEGADPNNAYVLNGAFGGTSAASPFVAGVAALMLSANPALSWIEVRDILRDTATKLPGMSGQFDIYHGYGLVNAYRAVLGAKFDAYPLEGVVSQNMTLPDTANGNPFRNVYLSGDLKIAEGCTLTVSAGTKIYAAVQDSANLGVDSYKVELLVDGVLVTQGTAADSVEFLCVGGGEGSWYGISSFSGTGSLDLNYTRITNGVYGLVSSSYENVWVKNCYFAENENVDIKIGGQPDSALVKDCFIEVGGGNGIILQSAAHKVTLQADTLQGTLGLSSDGLVSQGPNAMVVDCVIRDFKAFADGIMIESGSPAVRGGELRNCVSGIFMTGGSPYVGGTTSADGTLFTQNRFGIQTDCAGPGTCPQCNSFAPVVRRGTFLNNTNGIKVLHRGYIDLGNAISPGNSSFDGSNNWAIWNSDNCDTVRAVGNWFEDDELVSGIVDTTGSLPTPPQNSEMGILKIPIGASITVDRNPARSDGTVKVAFRSTMGNPDEVAIFAITGARVRTYPLAGKVNQGNVSWDGHDERGRRVAPGVYFVALVGQGKKFATTRVIVLTSGGEE